MAIRFLIRVLVALALVASAGSGAGGPAETSKHGSPSISVECRKAQRMAQKLNRKARQREDRPGSLGSTRIIVSCPTEP